MHTYSQSTGRFDDIATGYSGNNAGYNNPSLQAVHNIGPIPEGFYLIGPSFTHVRAGPLTMRLAPTGGTDTFHRDGFMIHGDTQEHALHPTPGNSASDGCIILDHSTRAAIAASNDRLLKVIP